MNLYGMVGNDAMNWVDILGLLSVEYNSKDEAARAALMEAKDLARKSHDAHLKKFPLLQKLIDRDPNADKFKRGRFSVEYGGLICSKRSCEKKFAYTGPITDNDGGRVRPENAPCPEGWDMVSTYHTHPDNNGPSRDDKTKTRQGTDDGSPREDYQGGAAEGDNDWKYGPGKPGLGGVPTYDVNPFK